MVQPSNVRGWFEHVQDETRGVLREEDKLALIERRMHIRP